MKNLTAFIFHIILLILGMYLAITSGLGLLEWLFLQPFNGVMLTNYLLLFFTGLGASLFVIKRLPF